MIFKKISRKSGKLYHIWQAKIFGAEIMRKSAHSMPDFLIIGAAKAGTTSLFQYLSQHPEIVTAKEKELYYFSTQFGKGLRWYLSNFPLIKEKKQRLTFEATPTYLYLPECPKRISRLLPNIKFIAILRDPVKRAYSHWAWHQESSKITKRGLIDKRPFSLAVEEEIHDSSKVVWTHKYLERGLYAQQLKEWYKYYDRESILVIDFDDLKNNPRMILKEVAKFLEIENIYDSFIATDEQSYGINNQKDLEGKNKLKTYNANVYKGKMDKKTEDVLNEYFRVPDQELEQLIGRKFGWMNKSFQLSTT